MALRDILENPSSHKAQIDYERKLRDLTASKLDSLRGDLLELMKPLRRNPMFRNINVIKQDIETLSQRIKQMQSGTSIDDSKEQQDKHKKAESPSIIQTVVQAEIVDWLILLEIISDMNAQIQQVKEVVRLNAAADVTGKVQKVGDSANRIKVLANYHQDLLKNPDLDRFASEVSGTYGMELARLDINDGLNFMPELDRPKLFKGKFLQKLSTIILQLGTEVESGIIPLSDFYVIFHKRFPRVECNPEDVEIAVSRLVHRGFLSLIDENGQKIVRFSQSKEDELAVLNVARKRGFATVEMLMQDLEWSKAKASDILKRFDESGMTIVESTMEGKKYYFPGVEN